MLEHAFNGPPFTVGIEEELMILDPDGWGLAQAIEHLLDAVPDEFEGQVKPELFQAVLEIATKPCADVATAGRELVDLRNAVLEITAREGLTIAAAASHPFAHWSEQKTVDRDRYRDLIDELGIIALQELIFGTHVHVAIEGADRAIYVADGIRRYLPLFLALSVNSPFWEGLNTGLMSSRVPVFRAFPREGIPPHYGTWEIFSHRVEQMMRAGAIPDYTFLWWDVRPHPKLGTVETRIFDQQTRVEHTVALAALNVCLAHRLCAALRRRRAAGRVPHRADRRQQDPGCPSRHRREADRLPRRRPGRRSGDGPRPRRDARAARRRARLRRRARRDRGPAGNRHRGASPARDLGANRRPRGADRGDRRGQPALTARPPDWGFEHTPDSTGVDPREVRGQLSSLG